MMNLLHSLSIAVVYAAPTAYYLAGNKWAVPVLILNSFIPLSAGLLMAWMSPEALAAAVNIATVLAIFIWIPMLALAARKLVREVNRYTKKSKA